MPDSRVIMQAVLRNPVLWGALATVGFYFGADAVLTDYPLAARYLAGHWAAYLCLSLFFVGVAGLVVKAVDLALELAAARVALFESLPMGQAVSECPQLVNRLAAQPARCQPTYLFTRLRAALDHILRKGSPDQLDEELRTLSEVDIARKHASYGTVRMMVWAIPFIGSLGTVVGIGQAVASLPADAGGNLVPTVASGLGLVFDTTALALTLSVVLMLGLFVCDQLETRLLLTVDTRVRRELVGRFRGTITVKDARSGGPAHAPEGFMGALEKLVERQTELFQASLAAANKQWEERTEMLKQQIESSQVSGGGRMAAPAMAGLPGDAAQWQEALLRSASLSAAQQAELAGQNELIQELADVIHQGSANWPVRRSRLFKPTSDTVAADAGWLDNV